jgi:hypothetical protein
MATFEGTSQEFKRFIGPYLRNVVNYLTRKQRRSVGGCEHCGSTKDLQSAHLRGRARKEIINSLLGDAAMADRVIRIDLNRFKRDFRAEHEPFEKAFLILCQDCHRKYDSFATSPAPPIARGGKPDDASRPTAAHSDILPITLDPPGAVAFKHALLIAKEAEMSFVYADGRIEVHHWDASKFSETSNLFGNLRSRPELRQGEWQSRGIVKVHVRIITNGNPIKPTSSSVTSAAAVHSANHC